MPASGEPLDERDSQQETDQRGPGSFEHGIAPQCRGRAAQYFLRIDIADAQRNQCHREVDEIDHRDDYDQDGDGQQRVDRRPVSSEHGLEFRGKIELVQLYQPDFFEYLGFDIRPECFQSGDYGLPRLLHVVGRIEFDQIIVHPVGRSVEKMFSDIGDRSVVYRRVVREILVDGDHFPRMPTVVVEHQAAADGAFSSVEGPRCLLGEDHRIRFFEAGETPLYASEPEHFEQAVRYLINGMPVESRRRALFWIVQRGFGYSHGVLASALPDVGRCSDRLFPVRTGNERRVSLSLFIELR